MNEIDKIFTSEIKHYEEEPPKEVWNVIESKLDKQAAKKYRRKYFNVLRIAICFALSFFSLLVFNIWTKDQDHNNYGIIKSNDHTDSLFQNELISADKTAGSSLNKRDKAAQH